MFLNRGEGKWRYMPNMNVHQMVGSVKYFQNKVGKITHSGNTSKTLSLATPIITWWLMSQKAMGGKNSVHEFSNINFY